MSEWWTYSLSDFLMFSAHAYYRLFELYNLALWPLHLFAVAAALSLLGAIIWPSKSRQRMGFAFLAIAWAWIAFGFHWERYADINTAAPYFAIAFAIQAAVLLFVACQDAGRQRMRARTLPALGIVGIALLVYPCIAVGTGRSWMQAEVVAIAPDPTAVATLGFLLATRAHWIAWLMPVLWCVISGLTLMELGAGSAWLAPSAALLALLSCGFARRREA